MATHATPRPVAERKPPAARQVAALSARTSVPRSGPGSPGGLARLEAGTAQISTPGRLHCLPEASPEAVSPEAVSPEAPQSLGLSPLPGGQVWRATLNSRFASVRARRTRGSFAVVLAVLLAGCGSIQLARPLAPAAPSDAPAPPLVRVWETDVEAAFGPAAPVVGGAAGSAALAIGTRNGRVVVLDAASGDRIGSLGFGASVDAGIALSPDGQTAYVAVARGRYAVVAQALRTGERRWGWRPDSSTQAVDAGLVLAAGVVVAPLHDGTILGLDAASGAERWRVVGTPGAQNHAAPIDVGRGGVAVIDDRGTVRALDAATGRVLWTATAGAPVVSAPTLTDGRLFAGTTRGTLAALDAATGAVLWTALLDPAGRARLSQPSAADGRVVVGLTDGRVVALDAATGAVAWTWTGTGAVVGAPLASGGSVYVGTMDRRLVAISATTGSETWSTELRGRVKSALAVADGRLIVLSEPRHVSAFEPAPATAAATPRN